ncbi:hypothetical protein V7S43_000029 [Phytophthora oleae]|uniref:Uncharacterized protein n=1 Tax=Phytophthora oleae TaxID=2107226 RepID=A0ABD3G8E7_9STRA
MIYYDADLLELHLARDAQVGTADPCEIQPYEALQLSNGDDKFRSAESGKLSPLHSVLDLDQDERDASTIKPRHGTRTKRLTLRQHVAIPIIFRCLADLNA